MKAMENTKSMGQNNVTTDGYLLQVENLKTYFPIKKGLLRRIAGYVKAVDGVSFAIPASKALALVGESGCGKTTVARSIVRLVPATEGAVVFDQVDVLLADRVKLRELRRQISLIFQDPYGSLNPRMTVGNIIGEPLKVQSKLARQGGERASCSTAFKGRDVSRPYKPLSARVLRRSAAANRDSKGSGTGAQISYL